MQIKCLFIAFITVIPLWYVNIGNKTSLTGCLLTENIIFGYLRNDNKIQK